ncbi:uncharacterized protein LOC106871428 [Octopus bimaculoides]|uniref:uncharacterized protein LOC106871428 n=1 Tax=Octopus bimaculoides TaxID=37653 RepID=UPI00071E0524|nr:uncharacterized protein LOC106871428 [Octopus bimaculoides]|eukprot:XP_014773364.1 PREDICTED: uncharacterized protein LOC106871428 [Octopus bimaculoides]
MYLSSKLLNNQRKNLDDMDTDFKEMVFVVEDMLSYEKQKMSLPNLLSFTCDITLWFTQLEAYFAAHAVPSQQQQLNLLCSIPAPLATSTRDLITDPHPDATYKVVKSEVLRRNTKSTESKFKQLMQDEELGDMMPSQFLHLHDNLLLWKLFSWLPPNVQIILVTAVDTNTMDQLATMADKILEFTIQPAPRHVCSCSEVSSAASSSSRDEIVEKLDSLTCRMDVLWRGHSNSSCRRTWSQPHSRLTDSVSSCPSLC